MTMEFGWLTISRTSNNAPGDDCTHVTMTKSDVDFVVRTLRESVIAALATLEKEGFWPPAQG